MARVRSAGFQVRMVSVRLRSARCLGQIGSAATSVELRIKSRVKRMKTARLVVLGIALSAGAVAAYLASGSEKTVVPEPVAQLPTVDILVAKSDIGLGQTVGPDDVQWQTWPAATASNNFIRRSERPDASAQV